MFDVLNRVSQILIGVGKVGDLFSSRGLTRSVPVGHWTALLDEITGMLNKVPRGLILPDLMCWNRTWHSRPRPFMILIDGFPACWNGFVQATCLS